MRTIWNSIESLSSVSYALQILVTILGALLITFSVRKSELEKRAAIEKDRIISQARRDAAAATERAENAILGQKQLDVKAEELRAKNLALERTVEEFKTMSALADEALAGSRLAYEKVTALSKVKSQLGDRAAERIKYVLRQLAYYEQPPGIVLALDLSFEVQGKQMRISELPTRKLFEFLQDERITDSTRFSVVNDLSKKPLHEVDENALALLREGQYLPAIAATCTILRRVHDKAVPFMDIDGWVAYLQKRVGN